MTAGWLRGKGWAEWRVVLGLALALGAIAQSARTVVGHPARLALVAALASLLTLGWYLQFGRWSAVAVWLVGGASSALMLTLPSTGPIVGMVGALITAGLRLPERTGVVAAAVLGVVFMLAYGVGTQWTQLGSMPFTALGLLFTFIVSASVRRTRAERERAEALLEALQRTRAAEIEHAALAERARIAREIHDVLAHTLSALAVQLEGTRMLVEQRPGDPAAVAAVERAHRLASEGLAEARRAIGALRGDRLPGPEGLQRLVEEFSQATGTPSQFQVSGAPVTLGSEAQLALYRTAQEALTNVRKHAPAATCVEVQLHYLADGVELLVEDLAPPTASPAARNGGYGLVGMRERAELLGGTLEAGPLPAGFRVRLWLPKVA
jgi:signal transduction histidine kinase